MLKRFAVSYEINKKQTTETPFLYLQREVTRETMSDALGEMFGAVFQHAATHGVALAGPPVARYASMGPNSFTIDAGMPIAAACETADDFHVGTLCGTTVASTIHKGPYTRLHEAHSAIEHWLEDTGEQLVGAPWEVYDNDPGEVSDPSEWITEVIWPLE